MKEMRIKKIPLPLGEGWVRVEGLLPTLFANSTLTRLAPLAGLSQRERHVLFVILLVLFGAIFSFGQTTSLSITVVDQQHAAIPNARVAVYPEGTLTAIRGTTNERGVYSAAVPSTGTFLVEVDADNFRKISKMVSADAIITLEVAGIDSS